MNKEFRKIIREEVYKIMQEMGQEDPVALSQDMVRQSSEQIKALNDELHFRENDARVSGLPKEDKEARLEAVKNIKKKIELANINLDMAKQSELNAVKSQQMQAQNASTQQSSSQTQNTAQSQVQSQI